MDIQVFYHNYLFKLIVSGFNMKEEEERWLDKLPEVIRLCLVSHRDKNWTAKDIGFSRDCYRCQHHELCKEKRLPYTTLS